MYTDFLLKETINSIVDRLGLEAAISFLQSAQSFVCSELSSQEQHLLLASFLMKKSSEIFDIPVEYDAKGQWKSSEARMACCYVFLKLTNESLSYAAQKFSISKRCCQYSVERVRERKTIPYYYRSFLKKVNELEKTSATYLAERFKSHQK